MFEVVLCFLVLGWVGMYALFRCPLAAFGAVFFGLVLWVLVSAGWYQAAGCWFAPFAVAVGIDGLRAVLRRRRRLALADTTVPAEPVSILLAEVTAPIGSAR